MDRWGVMAQVKRWSVKKAENGKEEGKKKVVKNQAKWMEYTVYCYWEKEGCQNHSISDSIDP